MSDIATLEAHLRSHLEDWPYWLVYADWLLEQGDVRGQLITLAYRLDTVELSLEERQSLLAQVKTLTEAHQDEWLSGYQELKGTEYTWRYGFVVGVKLPKAKTTLKKLALLCTHPSARFLTRLNLRNNYIRAEGARALAKSEHLRAFTQLHLDSNDIGDEGARALAGSEHLCALTHLYLYENNIGADGARALAGSEHLRGLTHLYLGSNHIGAEGARVLAGSEHLRGLTQLHLANNNVGDEGARAMAQSKHLTALTQLHMWNNNIGAAGVSALAQSVTLRHCKVLT